MTALRKASMRDIPRLLALINGYAAQGAMLARPEPELAESIRDFTVAVDDRDEVLACSALHFYTMATAEVRSLAVDPALKGKGIGRELVEATEKEAREMGISSLFAFTYVPGFFSRLGYGQVDRGLLPQKAWKDCLRCPKFQCCDEIAMLKTIGPETLFMPSSTTDAKVLEPELIIIHVPVLLKQ